MKKLKEKPWPEPNSEAAQPFKDAVEALHGKAKNPKQVQLKATGPFADFYASAMKNIDCWMDEATTYKPFPKKLMAAFNQMAFGVVVPSAAQMSFNNAMPGCGETTLHTAKPLPDAAYDALRDAGRLFDTEVDLIALARLGAV